MMSQQIDCAESRDCVHLNMNRATNLRCVGVFSVVFSLSLSLEFVKVLFFVHACIIENLITSNGNREGIVSKIKCDWMSLESVVMCDLATKIRSTSLVMNVTDVCNHA